MIQIPMHSRGAFDSGSLPQVNALRPSSTYSADCILSVNAPKRAPACAGPGRTPSAQAQARTQQHDTPSAQAQARTRHTAPSAQAQNRTQRTTPSAQAQTRTQQPASPAARPALPTPVLQKPVQKGQKVSIGDGALSGIHACFGWNVTDSRCDVDVSAFLLDGTGKVIGDSWFVFYGQTESPDRSTRLMETASGDREVIAVDLTRLNPAVRKIVFVMTIHEALAMRLHFGMLRDAYIRILTPADHRELVSFRLTDYYTNVVSMMIGEIYQHNGMWKFSAIGNGIAKDLAGLCAFYGVEVC